MIGTKNVTTEATVLFTGASIEGDTLVIQNDSDTDMFIAIGDTTTALTVNNGLRLEAGTSMVLEEPDCNKPIRGIHGGTGNKTLRWNSY